MIIARQQAKQDAIMDIGVSCGALAYLEQYEATFRANAAEADVLQDLTDQHLEKLGINANKAYQWGNTRKGYWRTVHSPILARALNNAFLKEAGFVSLKDITTPLKTVNV